MATKQYAEQVVSPVTVHAAVSVGLEAVGQRYTSQRRILIDVLWNSPRPLTMQELVAAGRSVPQSSAYRNIAVLEEAGLVHRIVTDDQFARFELSEKITGNHHHHVICSTCGSVEDFHLPTKLEAALAREFEKVAATRQFSTTSHHLDLIGQCERCA